MSDEPTYEELVGPEAIQDEDLEAGVRLAAHDLFLRLQGTFSAPAYITLEEVRDATGFDGQRTADAMAISLYRSRGKALWGFEMKVSRNDWLKELKQPEKAESIMRYCNYWGLVVPDKAIVKDGELPASWGMYVAQKNRLKCVVPCPILDPLPMSMTMLTALAYAINQRQSKVDEAALRAAKDAGYKEGSARTQSQYWQDTYKELSEKVEVYEKASGLQIKHGWQNQEKVGEAVKLLLAGNKALNPLVRTLEYCSGEITRLKEALDEQIKNTKSVMALQVAPEVQGKDDE